MKIVFNIITKNEESIILNSLNSVNSFVDAYCILDTGSTDKTLELLYEFKKSSDKPVIILESEFIDFSTSRNLVLEESKKLGEIVYWHDSDEYINPKLDLISLKEKILKIFSNGYCSIDSKILFTEYSYSRKNLFLNSLYTWKGIIHEYLSFNSISEKVYNLDDTITIVTTKGNSHSNQLKYLIYGNKLLTEYEKNKDPRDLFYAGNSFKDFSILHNKEFWYKAVTCYLERAKLEGYQEERYISLLYAGRLLKQNSKDFVDVLLSCEELNMSRIEHLYELTLHYYELGFYNASYIYSNLAFERLNSLKSNYKLFIENPIYEYKLLDLHLINCFKTNRTIEYRKTMYYLNYSLNNYNIPENDYNRIKQNLSLI